MKKLFTFLFALAAFNLSTHAELKFHETFSRNIGALNIGVSDAEANNTNDWYSFSGDKNYIQVVEGSLSYAGYVTTGTGNKAELVGNGADDLRQFTKTNPINSGKVYAAAIINVDSLKKSTTTDYFMALGNASNNIMYARLNIQSVKTGDAFTGFKLGIAKNAETVVFADAVLSPKTNYLVVLEYEFVAEAKNDVVRLYIDPTSTTTTPTISCDQTKANAKDDISYIASLNLRKSTNTPGRVFVDEIKVATTWAELFETSAGGVEEPTPAEPEIVADEVITIKDPSFYYTFTGETYTTTLTVMAENLTEDIALTSSSAELTLSTTTIAKDDADLAEGKEIALTLTPTTASPKGGTTATITLTSGTLTETVTVNWAALALTRCADVATLKAAGAEGYGWDVLAKFTGEAVVTFIESKMSEGTTTTFFTIQDATGAVNIDAPYWVGVTLGDKVTNILAQNEELAWGIQPFMAMDSKVTIVSRENKVTPQEVTLADLKANAADYLLELVVVKGVTLDRTAENFAQGSCKITQGEVTANINLLAGNPLIGTTKPAAANVTGISSSAAGTVIRPRNAEDIETVDVGAGMEAVETEESMEVYTLMGQRVSSLQPGVNIIRKGNTTYKVIR